MKKINWKAEYERERNRSKFAFWCAIISFVMIAIMMGAIIIPLEKQIKQLPPQGLGSTYYDAHGSAWVRFDLSDANQVILVRQIETVCKNYGMLNCMNALDRLGVKR